MVNPLRGKRALITGATAGIGLASAVELARRGADITILARNPDKAGAAVSEVERQTGVVMDVITADLADLASVRRAAETFIDSGEPLHILLNNAGIVNTRRSVSRDGYEETFAVNHLAPFLLTGMLLPRLLEQPGARIVNVASGAYTFCRGLDFDDLHSSRRYRTFQVYGKSKLANILFTRELSRRLETHDAVANSLHPGAVATSLGSQNPGLMGKILPVLLRPFFKSPDQGAATSVYLCADAEAGNTSGQYYVNCGAVALREWARDDEAAARLWDVSEQLTGYQYKL